MLHLAGIEITTQSSLFLLLPGQYFASTIILVTISIFITVYILSLHYRLPGTRPVPKYLKKIALVYLARILCMDNSIKVSDISSEENETNVMENNQHADHTELNQQPTQKETNLQNQRPLTAVSNFRVGTNK